MVLVSNNEHTKAERRWRRVGQRARRGTRAIRNAALRPSRGSRRAVPIGFETLLFTDPALNLRTSVEDPTTESNRLRSNVAVPPVVQSRLGKSILLTDILERQQLGWGLWVFTAGAGFVGHVLTVSHTSDYCHGVPSKKEGPVVVGRWNYLPPELRHPGPQVFFAEVTHAKYPGMRVRVEYDGDLNLEAITVMSSSDGPQLGARLLRDFPYGAIDAAARSRMAEWWREYDKQRPKSSTPISRKSLDAVDMRRPGRRGRPDREYAEIANEYVQLTGDPTVKKPVEELAERRFISDSQLRNLLYEARRRDLLTKAPDGKAGGTLTTRARSLLDQGEPEVPGGTPEQIAAAIELNASIAELRRQWAAGEIDADEFFARRTQWFKDWLPEIDPPAVPRQQKTRRRSDGTRSKTR